MIRATRLSLAVARGGRKAELGGSLQREEEEVQEHPHRRPAHCLRGGAGTGHTARERRRGALRQTGAAQEKKADQVRPGGPCCRMDWCAVSFENLCVGVCACHTMIFHKKCTKKGAITHRARRRVQARRDGHRKSGTPHTAVCAIDSHTTLCRPRIAAGSGAFFFRLSRPPAVAARRVAVGRVSHVSRIGRG